MKKAALITGASSGIGAAIAIEFSKNGYFVYLMGRNKERLQNVALKCRSGASIVSCDLSDEAALNKRLGEVIGAKIHRVECVVNNAGVFETHSTEEGSDEIWRRQFEINMLGPLRIARAFFPYFKEQGGGSIVNIASTLGLRPEGPTSAYAASKAALINWTQSLAQEGGPYKIRANCVCPGIVDTPLHSFHDLPAEKKNEVTDKMKSLQPLGRIGQPEDIAKAAYFLGSDQSAWITGAILPVDGGINL
ncbi:SDR family oxidoreductase [Bdellovibrio bacteriovorus]|uniref:SDR family NAD(P)-dependent oxidoreductase n=1 Tax=Bdellovibrio bacteriovorus TaxID=959 RepID=UPI0021D22CCD|nr:SDR family oxidoreductase [Bdellovibrio bacteriovorus]UXR63571.1 SDR family oxidoreductase [Bdellovibrio bacteriovorus]